MPYYTPTRKYNRRYTKYRKFTKATVRGMANTNPVTRALSKEIASVKRQLKISRPQLKYDVKSDTSISNGNVSNANPYYILLNAMTEGTAESNRIGNVVRNKYIDLTMQLFNTADIKQYRLMMICLKNPAGSSSTLLSGLFSDSTPNTYTNYDKEDKNIKLNYSILFDKVVTRQAAITGAGTFTQFKRRFHLRNSKTNYELATNSDITDITRCAFYWVVINDDAQITGTTIKLDWVHCYTSA